MTPRALPSVPRTTRGVADGVSALRLLVVVAIVLDSASTFSDLRVADASWPVAVTTTLQLMLATAAIAAVMWLRPWLAASLSLLVLGLALVKQPTSEELWLLLVIAVTVGARAPIGVIVAVAAAQSGYVLLFGLRVERGFPGEGFQTALILVVFCVVGYAAGIVVRRSLGVLDLRRRRLAELERENAQIRDTERLRLADDLQVVVTGGLAAIARQLDTLADQADDAESLRRGLDAIDHESRSVLTELRALLEILRTDASSQAAIPAAVPERGPRRWLTMLSALHVRVAASAGCVVLAIHSAFDLRGSTPDSASAVQLLGWLACAVAIWWPWIGAGVAVVALVVSLAAGSASDWSVLPTAVLFFLAAFRAGVGRLWVVTLALVGYGVVILITAPDPTLPVTTAAYIGVIAIVAGLGAAHFVDVGRASAQRHAGLLDDRERLETEERAAVARDLHDVVAHQLSLTTLMIMGTSASTDPQALTSTLRKVAESVEAAEHELSTLLHTMRGTEADHVQTTPLVLPSAGAETCARWLTASGFQPVIEVDRSADDLDVTTQRTLSRIMQEATTNIVRYAPTGSVCRYALAVAADGVTLTVASPLAVREGKSALSLGWGLRGIAERVELSHGTFAAGPRRGRWLVDVTLPRSTPVNEASVARGSLRSATLSAERPWRSWWPG